MKKSFWLVLGISFFASTACFADFAGSWTGSGKRMNTFYPEDAPSECTFTFEFEQTAQVFTIVDGRLVCEGYLDMFYSRTDFEIRRGSLVLNGKVVGLIAEDRLAFFEITPVEERAPNWNVTYHAAFVLNNDTLEFVSIDSDPGETSPDGPFLQHFSGHLNRAP